jgi:hypothetical protein
MSCPFHHPNNLRPDLPPLPERLKTLPVDGRGYPVPFFVAWVDGKPEFRAMDGDKLRQCLRFGLCWCCGQPLERLRTFVIGPMCTITRTSSEPASHAECAAWSVKGCPFLSRPNMVRREDEFLNANARSAPGIMIERNPGVSCLWATKSFRLFNDGAGKQLIEVGKPVSVSWWREGRAARCWSPSKPACLSCSNIALTMRIGRTFAAKKKKPCPCFPVKPMSAPLPDPQVLAAELKKLTHARVRLHTEIPLSRFVAIIVMLQLACRHPDVKYSPAQRQAENFARALERCIPDDCPALKALLAAGWDPNNPLHL